MKCVLPLLVILILGLALPSNSQCITFLNPGLIPNFYIFDGDIILSSTGTYLVGQYGILMKISNTEEFLWGKDIWDTFW